MKKAFYILGTICLAFKLLEYIDGIVHDVKIVHKRVGSAVKKYEADKVRQPIGFAVERIES